MSLLYLDACCIIYLIESSSPFHGAVARRILQHQLLPEAGLITSRLSRLECRVKPLREADNRLLSEYDSFFRQRRLHLAELSAAVLERATTLRARHGFKTPDALHLATAIEAGAGIFLTGDASLSRCSEIRVEVLPPPASSVTGNLSAPASVQGAR